MGVVFERTPRNLITDVAGIKVGNASEASLKSGVTTLLGDEPFTAAVHVMGGAPGTRETDLLAPDKLIEKVDALVFSGGSAFGLDAASAVANELRKMGRGHQVGDVRVPLVPAAIIFDLMNGGEKQWAENPYSTLGSEALLSAQVSFDLGTVGAGTGATTSNLKGGLGSASLKLASGYTVGALVVANPIGSAVVPGTSNFWAAPFEVEGEFGARGVAAKVNALEMPPPKYSVDDAGQNTTLAIVATDMPLDPARLSRLATAAHDGFARALVPSHTPFDGDLVFAISTQDDHDSIDAHQQMLAGHAAAVCVSRSIARAVYEATEAQGDRLQTWQSRWGDESAG